MAEIITEKNGEHFVDSHDLAKRIEVQPAKVTKLIEETLLPGIADFGVTNCHVRFDKSERLIRGKIVEMYLMTRDAFVLVIARYNSKKSRRWFAKYISAFNTMEQEIIEYKAKLEANRNNQLFITTWEAGKQIRNNGTDAIREVVEYAESCNSENAFRYYSLFTEQIHRIVGCNNGERDILTPLDINDVSQLEHCQAVCIRKYLDAEINYHDILYRTEDDLKRIYEVMLTQRRQAEAPMIPETSDWEDSLNPALLEMFENGDLMEDEAEALSKLHPKTQIVAIKNVNKFLPPEPTDSSASKHELSVSI